MKSAQRTFRQHAKTFYFASLFFPKQVFQDISDAYYFFRKADDIADKSDPSALETIEPLTEAIKTKQSIPRVFKKHQVDVSILIDFLKTMERDQRALKLTSRHELIEYCYGAAATVGLSLCPLLGIRNSRAYPFAVDLGIAMQLTNICRDVYEDFEREKIYLPEINSDIIKSPRRVEATRGRYLDLADIYYESAKQGYSSIPLRSRFCIILAANLYRKIGEKIRKSKTSTYRAHTTPWDKFKVLCQSLGEFLATLLFKSKDLRHNPSLHSYGRI